jgi:hypothetical protein
METGTLDTLLNVYRGLLEIFECEGPAGDVSATSLTWLIGEAQRAISILEDARARGCHSLEMRTALTALHNGMTRPHIGLPDYFVWRDDFAERQAANIALDHLKGALKVLHSSL